MRWTKRLLLAALIGAIAFAVSRALRRRGGDTVARAASTEWPPMTDVAAATSAPTWREPIDGECPEGFPIKANDNSGIFHVPDGRFYARTIPERCYANAADAERDGYRRAKA